MNDLFIIIEMLNELTPLAAFWSLGMVWALIGALWAIVYDRRNRAS